MALIADATSTLERLIQLRAAADGAEEAKALDTLRSELTQLANPFKNLAATNSVLHAEAVSLSAIPDLASYDRKCPKVV